MSAARVFNAHSDGSTLVVVPIGSAGGFTEEAISAELDALLAEIDKPELVNVVFDFEKVPWFGSSMLGAMHAMWKRVVADRGKMAVCNVSTVAREVLEVSRFDTLWPIFNSQKEALTAVTQR